MGLKSHEASNQPDWANVPPEDRNFWQRTAARTGGIIAPGNVVTAVGVGLSVSGLNDIRRGHKIRGTAKLVAGGVCDRLDGTAADMTGTKGPVGEIVDTAADKAVLAYAIWSLTRDGTLPVTPAVVIAAQNLANILIAGEAKKRGREVHPGWLGKIACGLQRAAPVAYVLESIAEDQGKKGAARVLGRVANVSTGVAVAGGLASTGQYAYETFGPRGDTTESENPAEV